MWVGTNAFFNIVNVMINKSPSPNEQSQNLLQRPGIERSPTLRPQSQRSLDRLEVSVILRRPAQARRERVDYELELEQQKVEHAEQLSLRRTLGHARGERANVAIQEATEVRIRWREHLRARSLAHR